MNLFEEVTHYDGARATNVGTNVGTQYLTPSNTVTVAVVRQVKFRARSQGKGYPRAHKP